MAVSYITNAALAQQVSDLLAKWQVRETQMQTWIGGTATGGDFGNGTYPLSDALGHTLYTPSPAALGLSVTGLATSAAAFAAAAGVSATAAAASATAAAGSATTATTQAGIATTKAAAAAASATGAVGAATTATAQAVIATAKAVLAAASAATCTSLQGLTQAEANAGLASQVAAAGSATAAGTSATNAATSATAAGVSATAAAASATAAAASAVLAATFVPALYALKAGAAFTGATSVSWANSTNDLFTVQGAAGANGGALGIIDGQTGTRHWQAAVGMAGAGIFTIRDVTAGNADRIWIDTAGLVGIGGVSDSSFKVTSPSGAGFRIGYNSTAINYQDGSEHHVRSVLGTADWTVINASGIGLNLPVTFPSIASTTTLAGANMLFGIGIAFSGGESEICTTGTNRLGIGTAGAADLNFLTASVIRLQATASGWLNDGSGHGIARVANAIAAGSGLITAQSGGTASGGNDGDIIFIY